LAALATKHNQLEISEESYSAALQIDKVEYLQHVKTLLQSNQTASGADVEAILIRHRKYSDAIEMAMCLHRWDAALDIADKHGVDVGRVLAERKHYLTAINRDETNANFLKR
jgi:intraflagellar transport protein 80